MAAMRRRSALHRPWRSRRRCCRSKRSGKDMPVRLVQLHQKWPRPHAGLRRARDHPPLPIKRETDHTGRPLARSPSSCAAPANVALRDGTRPHDLALCVRTSWLRPNASGCLCALLGTGRRFSERHLTQKGALLVPYLHRPPGPASPPADPGPGRRSAPKPHTISLAPCQRRCPSALRSNDLCHAMICCISGPSAAVLARAEISMACRLQA